MATLPQRWPESPPPPTTPGKWTATSISTSVTTSGRISSISSRSPKHSRLTSFGGILAALLRLLALSSLLLSIAQVRR
jgi:hypothetical protein